MSIDTGALWASLKHDAAGLVTAVVQHADTGQVLMVGYLNREALEASLSGRIVTFWSRSRSTLWRKGDTSGHTLALVEVRVDCDRDALLLRALPTGPTCHTGTTSCFFWRLEGHDLDALPQDDGPAASDPAMLSRVFDVIRQRQAGLGATHAEGESYVRRLLDGGAETIGGKLTEEAGELARALSDETDDRVASEAADLLFHTLVGLAHRGVGLDAVARVFASRFGVSGIDEKKSRT